MRFSAVFFFSACLAQSLAHSLVIDSDVGLLVKRDQGSNGDSNGGNNQNQSGRNWTEIGPNRQRNKNHNGTDFENAAVTITVTETQQARAALTVMTVTITQFQPCPSGAAGVGPSGSGLVSPPAPPAPSTVSTTVLTIQPDSVSTARKFVTNGNVQVGLTSIPVAVASSLGNDPDAAVPPPGPPGLGTISTTIPAMVSPGSFVTTSASEAYSVLGETGTTTIPFAGTTIVTEATLTPGLSSIPVADSRKSVT